MNTVIMFFLGLILGLVVASGIFLFLFFKSRNGVKKAQFDSLKIIKDAEDKSLKIVKEAQLEAKQILADGDRDIKARKSELLQLETKLDAREETFNLRDKTLIHKEETLEHKHEQANQKIIELEKKEKEINLKAENIVNELSRVAQLSIADAKKELLKQVDAKMAIELATFIKNKEDEMHSKGKEIAQNILGLAIQKYSQEVAIERTVSVVSLPNDEIKGRIIGREGRNIKTIEQLTGVDLIIDDTPEVITVSCFDPVRREVARRSLENLIKDGRIQPGRIEEIVEKTKLELEEIMFKAGEEAIYEIGISKMSKEIIEVLGHLKYRTSYGQNVLQHSKEVAYLAGIMAAELGLNQQLARRAGLLHDIGKGLDYEMEGSHVELGSRIAKKYGEHPVVINAIESHHGDVPATSPISILVAAADALSSARPGARSDTLENYIQRVEKLEEISKSFDGVSQAYAIQAGREIRVMVMPEKVDDLKIIKIAQEIKEKIESELTYPGQIKVTVIREIRVNELAK